MQTPDTDTLLPLPGDTTPKRTTDSPLSKPPKIAKTEHQSPTKEEEEEEELMTPQNPNSRIQRYLFAIEYIGTRFSGSQKQHESCRTVVGVLEEAFCKFIGQPVTVSISSRTDAGVHALSNVCHVDVERISKRKPGEVLPAHEPGVVRRAVNHFLQVLNEFTHGKEDKVRKPEFKEVLSDILLGVADGLKRDPIEMRKMDGQALSNFLNSSSYETEIVALYAKLDGTAGSLRDYIAKGLEHLTVDEGMPPPLDPWIKSNVVEPALQHCIMHDMTVHDHRPPVIASCYFFICRLLCHQAAEATADELDSMVGITSSDGFESRGSVGFMFEIQMADNSRASNAEIVRVRPIVEVDWIGQSNAAGQRQVEVLEQGQCFLTGQTGFGAQKIQWDKQHIRFENTNMSAVSDICLHVKRLLYCIRLFKHWGLIRYIWKSVMSWRIPLLRKSGSALQVQKRINML